MIRPDEMLGLLRGVHFLDDIAAEHLRPLTAIAELRDYPAGAVLFREGQEHHHIYLLDRGSVALEVHVPNHSDKRLETVGPGELLGWSPVLGHPLMTATARTLQPTRAIAIRASQLMAVCEHDPRFGLEFMRRTAGALSKRLSAMRLQLLDVYGHELPSVPAGEEV